MIKELALVAAVAATPSSQPLHVNTLHTPLKIHGVNIDTDAVDGRIVLYSCKDGGIYQSSLGRIVEGNMSSYSFKYRCARDRTLHTIYIR